MLDIIGFECIYEIPQGFSLDACVTIFRYFSKFRLNIDQIVSLQLFLYNLFLKSCIEDLSCIFCWWIVYSFTPEGSLRHLTLVDISVLEDNPSIFLKNSLMKIAIIRLFAVKNYSQPWRSSFLIRKSKTMRIMRQVYPFYMFDFQKTLTIYNIPIDCIFQLSGMHEWGWLGHDATLGVSDDHKFTILIAFGSHPHLLVIVVGYSLSLNVILWKIAAFGYLVKETSDSPSAYFSLGKSSNNPHTQRRDDIRLAIKQIFYPSSHNKRPIFHKHDPLSMFLIIFNKSLKNKLFWSYGLNTCWCGLLI